MQHGADAGSRSSSHGWWLCSGAAVVWFVPDRYEATSRIYVDTQTVLKPLMAGLAFQPDIDQQVRMLARTLVSRPNIELLIDRPGANDRHHRRQSRPDDRRINRDRIKVDPTGGNLYVISFRDTDSRRCAVRRGGARRSLRGFRGRLQAEGFRRSEHVHRQPDQVIRGQTLRGRESIEGFQGSQLRRLRRLQSGLLCAHLGSLPTKCRNCGSLWRRPSKREML